MPGGFLDVLSYFSRGGNENAESAPGTGNISNVPVQNLQGPGNINSGNHTPLQDVTESRDSNTEGGPAGLKGKGKEVSFVTPQLSNISRMWVKSLRLAHHLDTHNLSIRLQVQVRADRQREILSGCCRSAVGSSSVTVSPSDQGEIRRRPFETIRLYQRI